MSKLTTTARPYARAAFELANVNGEQAKWSEMLAYMAAVAHDPAMRAVLGSPRLSQQQAADLLIAVCAQHINKPGKNFIRLLAEDNRIPLLPEIAAMYQYYRADAEGTVDAEVIAASAIDDQRLARIRAALQRRLGKNVRLRSRIDKALIGGGRRCQCRTTSGQGRCPVHPEIRCQPC